jgi:hypothetical protein
MRVFSFFLLLLLLSCSKSRRTEKRLEGTWKATFVKVENGEGFTHYDSLPEGNLNFDVSTYTLDGKISFKTKNISGQQQQDSLDFKLVKFEILNQNDLLEIYKFPDTIKLSIVQLTPFDLQLEYYDSKKFSLKKITFNKLK